MESEWQSVWITGASSGLGLELARLMDSSGEAAHIAISARSKDKLAEAETAGKRLAAHPLDVTDADAVTACVRQVEAKQGPIDLAVLCAGVWTIMDSPDMELKAMRLGIEVNYMGVVNAIVALLPGMLERGGGHIAIVASVAGFRGLPKAVAYGPTKAALISLAETLRGELEPKGITITVVNPGFIDTPMTENNPFPMPGIVPVEEAAAKLLAGLKAKRYEISFPPLFVYGLKALRRLPNAVFFWIVRTFILKSANPETVPDKGM